MTSPSLRSTLQKDINYF